MDVLDRLAARRRAAAHAGLAALFAAVLATEVRLLSHLHRSWPLDLLVGLLVCGAVLLRGRAFVTAASVALSVSAAAALAAWRWDLPGEPGFAATLALLVLLASAVRGLAPRPAAGIAAAGAAVAVLSMVLHPDLGGLLRQAWGAALGAGLLLRLWDVRRQAALDRVRREERLVLARELHDVAAHHMTGVVLQAQAARIAARRHPELLDGTLAGIETAGTGALQAVRRVIGLLRDDADTDGLLPGPERLEDLVARFAERGPRVRLCLPDGPAAQEWPPELSATVHRVVQEALTNVARHAPDAAEVTVTVAHDRSAVTVEVADDAPGHAPHRFPGSGGYGLTGMRERVHALGGTLSAGPRPGRGWSVRATLPVPGRP